MFSFTQSLRHTCLLLLITCSNTVFAGGPLVLQGPDGQTPVTYSNPALVLNLDPGPLGSRSNTNADALMRDAFALWNAVSTSTILLTAGADLSQDIDDSNFTTVLPNTTQTELHENDGLNPVVYDSDGKIIDLFFGIGASNNTVGFAASIIFIGQSNFVEGYAVINGKSLPGLTEADFKLLIAHEMGHLFGLDHTQTNISNAESFSSFPRVCQTSSPGDYAVMYPFICRNINSLHADDISAVSGLYPTSDIFQNFGVIDGFFVDSTDNPVLGANIWAENTVTGEAISTVSDYRKQGNGAYSLLLPPGNYTLHANSINPEFNAGSAIGPYAKNSFDLSFRAPHPFSRVTYQTQTTDSNGNTTTSDAIISVNTGRTVTVNFNINGQPSASSSSPPSTISPPPPASAPPTTTPATGSSGGGSLSVATILIFLGGRLLLRRRRWCQSQRQFI